MLAAIELKVGNRIPGNKTGVNEGLGVGSEYLNLARLDRFDACGRPRMVLRSGRSMSTLMIIMAEKSPRVPRSSPGDLVPPRREMQVGFRVRRADAAYLVRLARKAGVGPMTLARLVIEKYLADQRRKESGT